MISGTSKIWSKSGPVDLLIITKMLKTIQEIMESSWENISFFVNMGLKNSKIVEKMYVLGTIFVRFVFGFCEKLNTHVDNIFVEMRIGK